MVVVRALQLSQKYTVMRSVWRLCSTRSSKRAGDQRFAKGVSRVQLWQVQYVVGGCGQCALGRYGRYAVDGFGRWAIWVGW